MKKKRGFCPRCGEVTIGVKRIGWAGHKSLKHNIRPEKKGQIKCLSCQQTTDVKVYEEERSRQNR